MAKKKQGKRKKKSARKKPSLIKRLIKVTVLVGLLLSVIFVAALDIIVRNKFSGAKWSLPSHVYSRALELYEGLPLTETELLWELKKLGYGQVGGAPGPGQYRLAGSRVDISARAFEFWDGPQAAQNIRLKFDSSGVSKVANKQGNSLSVVRLEPLLIGGIYPDHLEDREPVGLESLPPFLIESLIAVEDRNFYQHRGVSPRGIARAMFGNLRAGKMSQGGSTITQQLVKNFYLSAERTLLRKGMEAIMAVLLEVHYSKGEILEAYINEIYLGQSGKRAIHGFGMASRHYFRQPLEELDLHQIALLTGLAKGASYYDPRRHPERALARRNLVIDQLETQQLLDNASAKQAKTKALDISTRPGTNTNLFPAYLDLIRRQLRKDYQDDDLRSEGLRIFTRFDPQVQNTLQSTLASELSKLEQNKGIKKASLQAAAVVVRVGTGEVVAIAGSRQAGFAGFNRALDTRRPVGSTIKPAVYLTALQQAQTYTLATLLDDSAFSKTLDDGEVWRPRNFDHQDHGEVPLYEALGRSYNQSTARLGINLGINHVADTIRALGYERPIAEVPALTLGAISMSPFDVAGLYHTIASDGYYSPLSSIDSVYTTENEPLKRYPRQSSARFQPHVMHLLQYAMQVVMREGTGKGAYRVLPGSTVLAGKTGTSNDQRDSWFAGFGGNYLTVVWVGRDDNGVMPITGSSGALKVWSKIMANIGVSSFAFTQPENIVYEWIDPVTGLLTDEHCEQSRYLPFIKGSAPSSYAPCGRRKSGKVVDWLKDVFRW
ncbi:MAG: penicillin-binding protein 1B [Porticoccaceae bacterium]|nr:penicillin-binding protein 1B [Porticoccaceae bacterium]